MEVCSGERGCVTQMQGWSVNTVEAVETEMETVVVQAVVTGPAEIIILPSFSSTITDTTPITVDLSTTFAITSTSTSLEVTSSILPATTSSATPTTVPLATATSCILLGEELVQLETTTVPLVSTDETTTLTSTTTVTSTITLTEVTETAEGT